MTGTVDVTSGSASVAGLGTTWLANVTVGDLFMVRDIYTNYQIASIPTDSSITISPVWAGTTLTGQNYQIVKDFTPEYDLIEIHPGDRNWAFNITENFRSIDTLIAGIDTTVPLPYDVESYSEQASVILTISDLNKVHVCSAATLKCTITLPSISVTEIGYWVKIRKAGAGEIEIVASDSDTVMDTGTKVNNAYITETAAFIELYVETATHWGCGGLLGRWTTS